MKAKKNVIYTAALLIIFLMTAAAAVFLYIPLIQEKRLLDEMQADFTEGDFQLYLDTYDELSEEQQILPDLLLRAGISLHKLKEHRQAADKLELYRALYPELLEGSVGTDALFAESLFRIGEYDRVIEVLSGKDQMEAAEQLLLGLSYLEERMIREARQLIGSYITGYPSIAERFFQAYLKEEDTDSAYEILKNVRVYLEDGPLYDMYQQIIDAEKVDSLRVLQLRIELAEQIEDAALLYDVYRSLVRSYTEHGMLIEAKQAARTAEDYRK